MQFSSHTRFFERVFIGIILLTLSSFAYYFTAADLEEVQTRFLNRRVVLTKLLSREIADLLNRRSDLTPRLSNLLSEEAVAYTVVQQTSGEIVAKAENPQISVGAINDKVESASIESTHLILTSFLDPSNTVPLVETAMPLVTEAGKKLVLRVGFFRVEEEDKLREVRFRNVLFFSTLLVGFLTYWVIRRRNASNLQNTWMGGTGVLILFLFLSNRFILQEWYERHWRQNFVQHGMTVAKVVGQSAKRFLVTGDEGELKDLQGLLERDENYLFMSVAKDEQYLYHSDPTQKGAIFSPDRNYGKSLNSENPTMFKTGDDEQYEILVPLIEGLHRLGTLRLGLRNATGYGPLGVLRNRLILTFLTALVLALFLVHLLSRRIAKEASVFMRAMEQVTAGDLRQQVFIDRNDEFGQMAQAFNFMLMSLKERDLLGKGLQNYVSKSIVEKTLKVLTTEDKCGEKVFSVCVFIYFNGLTEAINRLNCAQIFANVRELYQTVRQICSSGANCQVQIHLSGILALHTHHNRQEAIMQAVNSAQMLNKAFMKRTESPFSPRITLHALEVIHGVIDDQGQVMAYLGEGMLDFKAFSQVQDQDEIIISEETSFLLKDISNLDELEVVMNEQGRIRAYVFHGFRNSEALIKAFPEASTWTKTMILKILKGQGSPDQAEYLKQWYSDPEPSIRYYIMDVLERLRPSGILDFIVKAMSEESDPKVLSKTIAVLGKVGNESHIPILTEKLRTNDRRVKANAVEALEAIGGKKVYEFLNLLVDEQDNRVKANILIALGKYGDLKVFELLSRMMKDSDKNMRASAAYALGKLGMAQGVEPLIAALSDKDIGVRRQVVASLTSLKADLEIDI